MRHLPGLVLAFMIASPLPVLKLLRLPVHAGTFTAGGLLLRNLVLWPGHVRTLNGRRELRISVISIDIVELHFIRYGDVKVSRQSLQCLSALTSLPKLDVVEITVLELIVAIHRFSRSLEYDAASPSWNVRA